MCLFRVRAQVTSFLLGCFFPPTSPSPSPISTSIHPHNNNIEQPPAKCRPTTIPRTSRPCLRCRLRHPTSSWMLLLIWRRPSPSPRRASRNTSPRLRSSHPKSPRRRRANDHPRRLTNMFWQTIPTLLYVPASRFLFIFQKAMVWRVLPPLRRDLVAYLTSRALANSCSSL